MANDSDYTVETLAELMVVSPATIYRMARNGSLPHYKVGKSLRFPREEIKEFRRSSPLVEYDDE